MAPEPYGAPLLLGPFCSAADHSQSLASVQLGDWEPMGLTSAPDPTVLWWALPGSIALNSNPPRFRTCEEIHLGTFRSPNIFNPGRFHAKFSPVQLPVVAKFLARLPHDPEADPEIVPHHCAQGPD
jgi:hypothetical protein